MTELEPERPTRRRRPRFARRLNNHLALGVGSATAAAAIFRALDSTDPLLRASMATAYVALGLLVGTLAFGPIAALRGRRYPVTTDIRRDFGIWAGVVGVAHVIVGLQVHLRGKMWEYFVHAVKGTWLPRIDPFGAANYTGAVATLLLVVLLATSNDASVRRLGAVRWQRVHQSIEWALILTLLHAGLYQWVEKRRPAIVVAFVVIAVAALAIRIGPKRAKRD